jgi:phosphatidylinositol alpha-1,6-mannosyltransferase
MMATADREGRSNPRAVETEPQENAVTQRSGGDAPKKNRMSLLLVSEVYPPDVGGSATLFGNIYPRLPGEVRVLTHNDTMSREGSSSAVTVLRSGPLTTTWSPRELRGLSYYARRVAAIRRLAPRGRAIVHCGRAAPEGFSAWLARCVGAADYVCWVHGEELAYAQQSREIGWLMRTALRGARAVLANSHNTARLVQRFGVRADRVHVVYPAIDPTVFRPGVRGDRLRARYAPEGGPLVLSVGRLQKRKGHDLVIDALGQLVGDLPGLRYVIAGEGEERQSLEAKVRERRLERHVIFAGAVAQQDLPALYAAADLFVMPNRVEGLDFEGFGIVFLEAAATAVPAIAGRSGGAPEAVLDAETGLLVDGTDPGELAAAMRRLLLDPSLRAAFGKAAAARVVQHFTWARAAAEVDALHERMAASP